MGMEHNMAEIDKSGELKRKDLIKLIAEKVEVSQKVVGDVINETFNLIGETLIDDNKVVVNNFGSFKPTIRAARRGRNPQTGQPLQIPESRSIKFTISSKFKEKLRK